MQDSNERLLAKISMPEKHAIAFNKLARLDSEQQHAIYQAVGAIPAGISVWDSLAKIIESQASVAPDDAKALSSALMGLSYARQRAVERSDSEFVEGAIKGIRDVAVDENVTDAQLQAVVVNLLALKNLELSFRATRVRFDHANHLHDSSITTDLRPIFDSGGSTIEAAVICHTFKISFASHKEESDELFLAVDDLDLDKLEAAVKRARRKAAALQLFAAKSNLRLIDDPL